MTRFLAFSRWIRSPARLMAHVMGAVMITAFCGGAVTQLSMRQQWPGGVAFAIVAAVLAVAASPLVPQRVQVGDDGVTLGRLGFSRFVSFREIALLERGGRPFAADTLVLESGERIPMLPLRGQDVAASEAAARIQRAVDACRERAAAPAEELVARADRPVGAWLEALKKLTHSDDAFRVGAQDRDGLLRTVEDPTADPTARVGAATVLRASLTDDERTRIRVAAEKSLAPKVRIALEATTEESLGDDDLARRLDGVRQLRV